MGSINAIPEYQTYYNLGSNGAASTGLVFSILQIGQMVGALFSWVCDWQRFPFSADALALSLPL
jgi:hypothetical protein